jgi:hypothetical protein
MTLLMPIHTLDIIIVFSFLTTALLSVLSGQLAILRSVWVLYVDREHNVGSKTANRRR